MRLPVLDIQPVNVAPPVASYDLLIFISTNAVQHGHAILAAQPQARLAAVGTATAQALIALGHRIDVMPEQAASSEALLAHPLLQTPPAQILIVRGTGGRELLRDTLTARGSQVTVAEVYARVAAQADATQLQMLHNQLVSGEIDVISITSADILRALHDLLDAPTHVLAQSCALLVGSARIALLARQLGWSGEYIIATSPEDAAMTSALTYWHTRARSELLR